MKETYDYLEMCFEDLLTEGQPFTIVTVRIEVGMQFRDDAMEYVVLPPHF